jgi:hypothetical protein
VIYKLQLVNQEILAVVALSGGGGQLFPSAFRRLNEAFTLLHQSWPI